MLDRLFHLSEQNTTVRTEVLAGLTTFLTMAYIVVLQPNILAGAGMDRNAILLATALSAGLASIAMGLYARYPVALAPGMGENFFFVTVVGSLTAMHFQSAWQVGLGIVFCAGIVFFILSVVGVREAIIDSISPSMRHAIAAGIGLFIAFIGLGNAHLIVNLGAIIHKTDTFVSINSNLLNADIAVFGLGLIVAATLQVRRVRGAILWGIVAGAILAAALGKIQVPASIFGIPQIAHPTAFQLDIMSALKPACIPFIILFVVMGMLDATGTLIAVAQQAGFVKDNKIPRVVQVLAVDSGATVAGAALGTSTVTVFIESAAGVAYGGRTGLTAVTTGVLFLLTLLLSPLIVAVGQYGPITAPALVVVGVFMLQTARHIEWDDFGESIPAFLVIVGIPLCYSIADGLALGFITYAVIGVLSGRGRKVHWLMYIMAAVLLAYLLLIRSRLA